MVKKVMLRFRDCIDFGSVLACEEGEGGVYAKERRMDRGCRGSG